MSSEHAEIRRALDPVMLELGATVYISQLFENSLTFLHELIDHDEAISARVPRLPTLYSRRTLGQLLVLLQKRIDVPPETVEFLLSGVEMRNKVVHRYITDRILQLKTEDGRVQVIEELRQLRDAIRMRDRSVCELIDSYLKKHGMPVTDELKRLPFFQSQNL